MLYIDECNATPVSRGLTLITCAPFLVAGYVFSSFTSSLKSIVSFAEGVLSFSAFFTMSDNESEAAPSSSAPEWFKAYVQESKKRFGEIEKVIVRLSNAAELDGAHEPAAGSSAEHNRPPSTATPDYQQTNRDRPRVPTSESVMPTTDFGETAPKRPRLGEQTAQEETAGAPAGRSFRWTDPRCEREGRQVEVIQGKLAAADSALTGGNIAKAAALVREGGSLCSSFLTDLKIVDRHGFDVLQHMRDDQLALTADEKKDLKEAIAVTTHEKKEAEKNEKAEKREMYGGKPFRAFREEFQQQSMVGASNRPWASNPRRQGPPQSASGRCYNCGRHGHLAQQCKSVPAGQSGGPPAFR